MKKIGRMAELAWLIGVIMCPLGVCLCSKSGLGVSMIAAPTYIIYLKMSETFGWFTYGVSEYLIQGALVLGLAIVIGRFKWKYLLSFLTGVCYGLALDGWFLVFGREMVDGMALRLMFAVGGLAITAFAIALFLRTYLPQQSYELVVKEVADKWKLNMNKVKWINDAIYFVVSVGLMLVLFRRFDTSMVGVNTILATVINAPMIGFFGHFLDKIFDFGPVNRAFYDKFEKLMD